MARGLPVLTSDVVPVKRIVTEERCGMSYAFGNVAELSDRLIQLQDPGLRAMMAREGQRAVNEKYNWAADAQRLNDALATVVSR